MGSFTRFTRYIKDFWKVFIRGENDDLRLKTLSMEEELARLRQRRLANDKEREEAALSQARHAVQKIRELHENLATAEKAVAEVASRLGEAARKTLETHQEMQDQARKKFFMQHKQQMFAQKAIPDMQHDKSAPISELDEQEKESRMPRFKTSRAPEDKDILLAAMGVDGSDVTEQRQPKSHAMNAPADERNQQDVTQSMMNPASKDVSTSSAETSTSATADNLESMEEIPPDVLARVLEEAKKQVRLEEKSQFDDLSRTRTILEEQIQTRELAERASMPKEN